VALIDGDFIAQWARGERYCTDNALLASRAKQNPFSSAELASPEPCAKAGPRLIGFMCRAIKTLHNFSPAATNDEIRASSLQFVRKLSGFTKPSRANEEAFNRAVDDVAHAAHHLLESLVTNAPPRNRETEALKAKARSAKRYRTAKTVAA
jgi:hypothetical protein